MTNKYGQCEQKLLLIRKFLRGFSFRETEFAYAKFRKKQNPREITLSITDIGKSCPSGSLNFASMSFNAIRENKTLAKISGKSIQSALNIKM